MFVRGVLAFSILLLVACSTATSHAEQAIVGFALRDGKLVPQEPYIEGQPRVTGLQLPWPPMPSLEANAISAEKIALGKLMFFDPILSGQNDMSCATCHNPDFGFSDGRKTSMGFSGKGLGPERTGGAILPRNAPTIWNAAYNFVQFWDGRAKDLEQQAEGPITSPEEMGENPDNLVKELRGIPEYVQLFEKAFGGNGSEAITFRRVTEAVATFERTLLSFNSRYDRFTQGDSNALNESEKRGLRLFRSVKTRCFECHRFPTFSDPTFRIIGVPPLADGEDDLGRGKVDPAAPARAFKVPTLRNIALSAPYMHNGVFKTLEQVVDFYATGGGHQFKEPVNGIDDKIGTFSLIWEERTDLVNFLHTLTDTSMLPDPPDRVPSGLPIVDVKSRAKPAPPAVDAKLIQVASADEAILKAPAVLQAAADVTPVRLVPAVSSLPSTPQLPAQTPLPTGSVITVRPGQPIQPAIDRAQSGDRVEVHPGIYNESVVIAKPDLQFVGLDVAGDRPVLDGQGTLKDGIRITSESVLVDGFTVRNYLGNGVTANKTKNVFVRNLVFAGEGAFGIRFAGCENVSAEKCVVAGADHAGLFAGQCNNVVVRNSEFFDCVAGIEIENTSSVVVANNSCHHNSVGVFVLAMPLGEAHEVSNYRIAHNRIWANNHENFAKPGSMIDTLPPGVGVLAMGIDHAELTKNVFAQNGCYGVAIVGLPAPLRNAAKGDANSDFATVEGNVYEGNGKNLSELFKKQSPNAPGGDILWDGTGQGHKWVEGGQLTTTPPNLIK